LVEAAMAPFRQAMMMMQGQQQQQGPQQQQQHAPDGPTAAAAVGPNGGKLRGPRDAGAPPLPRSAYLMFVTVRFVFVFFVLGREKGERERWMVKGGTRR
jgi:hypothetical protein